MKRSSRVSAALISAACLALPIAMPAGCASSETEGEKQTAQAATSLKDLRASLVKTNDQLSATLASLNALATQSEGDLKPAYKKYSEGVAKTKSDAAAARARADDMKARTEEYAAQWAEASSDLSPELKAKADARRATVRERFGKIQTAATATKDAFDPLMLHLEEIQKYLANDLTFGGIGTLGDVIQKTNAEGADVQARVSELIAELDKVAEALSSNV
jgi:chromosome segregation ATPase